MSDDEDKKIVETNNESQNDSKDQNQALFEEDHGRAPWMRQRCNHCQETC